MDEATFADAVLSNLEAGSDIRLQQFLAQARNVAASSQSEPGQVTDILDRVTVLGVQSIFFGRDDKARAAVDTLHEVYMQVAAAESVNTVSRLVEIITRAYVLGSLALRRRQWSLVRGCRSAQSLVVAARLSSYRRPHACRGTNGRFAAPMEVRPARS
jgi:hypothetical protein